MAPGPVLRIRRGPPPPHRHRTAIVETHNMKTLKPKKSAPSSGDRSATAPHKWKRTLKSKVLTVHVDDHTKASYKASIVNSIMTNVLHLSVLCSIQYRVNWTVLYQDCINPEACDCYVYSVWYDVDQLLNVIFHPNISITFQIGHNWLIQKDKSSIKQPHPAKTLPLL